MSVGKLYHLHTGHEVINGVCIAKEVNSQELYLLLIQVSLSSYAFHQYSKANGVCDNKKTIKSKTIAEYYRTLIPAVEIAADNVIYVYASPAQSWFPRSMKMPSGAVYTVGSIIKPSETWTDLLTAKTKTTSLA